ncbi:hypothetical protein [Streptomyces palmae]|uniref:hypothetical protein n=1 Tax=Streptomyces palmae TaxID=1701085 RepID=UPI001ADEDF3D|nr:hypothetical protein [Streptomyces palmae]
MSVDLSTRDGARSIVAQGLAAVDGIDFLVNNVGAGDPEALSLDGFLVDDEYAGPDRRGRWGSSTPRS